MSEPRDQTLDDVIANLHSIRDQIEDAVQASSPPAGRDEMKAPDRTEEEPSSLALEEYLASRLQQLGEVVPERKEIRGLKTGNGWDASKVIEHVFKIEPISAKRATEIALSSNRSFKQRLKDFMRRRKEELKLVGTPTVEFVPIWKVKGFHECYFLRTNTYRVTVRNDVVGVEVEGTGRDLILERKHRRLIPTALVERFHMLGSFLTSESKYFVISDVLELAIKKSESELAMTGMGKPLNLDEEMALTSWRTKRVFDLADLKARGARVRVRECTVTKDALLAKFREKVVRMPERFKQILSNRLQITELRRIYVPVIRVMIQKGLVPLEVVVNGSTGEIADETMLELLE